MTTPRYYSGSRVPTFVWLVVIAVAFLVAGWFLLRAHERSIRADERRIVLAGVAHFDTATTNFELRALRRITDSLRKASVRVDTVLRYRIDSVPHYIAAVPESIYLQSPVVESLGRAYERLAVDCEQCRQTTAALRQQMAVNDSAESDLRRKQALLVLDARIQMQAAFAERDRRPKFSHCAAAGVGLSAVAFLAGLAK